MSSSASRSDALETAARFGFAIKGVLYVLIGVLAAMAAFSGGGKTAGSKGAIKTIAEAPAGPVLLWIIAAGMGAYALWRFAQCFLDPGDEGGDVGGVVKRVGYFVSGLAHAALTVWVVRSQVTSGGSGSGGTQEWTARLLAQPFGPWLVGIVGASVVGYGLYRLYKAATVDFSNAFNDDEMSETEKTVTRRVGQAGLSARGVVFGIIGGFLIHAALSADAEEAKGLGGALDTLAAQPFGPYLLGAVAAGLVAFGVYCWVSARYRTIG